MTTFTTRMALPRPGLTDPADGPDGFNDLTDILDPKTAVFAQGTYATRPAAGVAGRWYWATDLKLLFYDDGSVWTASGPNPPLVTSLPATPVDGQEIYFQNAAMATDGLPPWHLRYRAGSAQTHKWEVVGAVGWAKLQGANASQTTAAPQTYTAMANSPSFTLPLAGYYHFDADGSLQALVAGGGEARVQIGVNGTPTHAIGWLTLADQWESTVQAGGGGQSAARAAGDVISLMVSTSNVAFQVGLVKLWRLVVTPIRVG